MNVITGLPRSGSTLLCNVLNQNPRIHASSTSVLYSMLALLVKHHSNSPEIIGDLGRARTETEKRFRAVLQSMCLAWYNKKRGKVIFDKSRAWASDVLLLREISPGAKVIVVVRDLRDVLASIEKQHRKTALFNKAENINQNTLWARTQALLQPEGMVGHCLMGVKDIIDRQLPDIFWLRYEDFVAHPDQMMERLYVYLELNLRSHNFTAVENTSTDSDNIYLNKFPHNGEGEIKPVESTWQEYMHPEIAARIMEGFQWYNKKFKYGFKQRVRPKNVASSR